MVEIPASKLGIMIAGRQPLHDLVVSAKQAEDAGFNAVFTGDGGGDVFATLLCFALNTTRIKLGSSVAVWHRPPVIAATAMAQIARASDNRLVLGLGAGPKDWNENWWGINFDKPIGRMSEYVQILRGILSEPRGSYSFAGKHFQIRDYQLRQQVSSVPPIYLGTVGRQMNRLAGRIADGVLFDVCLPPLYLREAAIPAIDEGLAASGRTRADFTLGAMIPIGIDNDRKTALRAVKRSIASHLENAYFYPVWAASGFEQEARAAQAKLKVRDRAGALDAISDDFARLVGIAGTADDVRRQTAEWLALVDEVDFLTSPFLATDDEVTANQQRILETFGK